MSRPVLVRVAAIPIDALAPLRVETATPDLDRAAARLEEAMFEAAGPAGSSDPKRPEYLAIRRAAHARKRPKAGSVAHPTLDAYLAALDEEERAQEAIERGSLASKRALVATLGEMRLALRLVSRSLLDGADRLAKREPSRWSHGDRHRAVKVAAYLGRAATKTSPNGLFCATAIGKVGEELSISGSPEISRIDALLSVAEARKCAAVLAADPKVRRAIPARPEPTLRREGEHWTFWRAASPRRPDRDEEVRSRIRASEAVDLLFDGGSLADLGVEPEQEKTFVEALVEAGALVHEIGIPYAEPRPLRFVLDRAREAGVEPEWAETVEEIERRVDALGASAGPGEVDAIVGALRELPHVRELAEDEAVRVDAAADLEVTIPGRWIDELRDAVHRYARLYAAMYPPSAFREAAARPFLARFPADRDVCALDLYHGVFDGGEDAKRPTSFPEEGRNRVADEVLRRWAEGATRLEELLPDDPPDPRWACGVLFQATREGRLVLSSLFHGAGLALARFSRLHGEGVVEELRRAWSFLERDGAIVAEMTYNHNGRTANAGLRPSIFEHEILLPGEVPTPGRTVIPFRELFVRWSSEERRFVASWNGVEVLPVINSGVNPTGVVSFLVGIGQQELQPLAWFPGFDDPKVDRWSRITSGNVVVFRERRVFRGDRIPSSRSGTDADWFFTIRRWREREGLPGMVFVHTEEDPKPRAIDLDAPVFVDLLRRTIEAQPSALHVTEMLPGPDDLLVVHEGRGYASEFLVHLEHAGGASR